MRNKIKFMEDPIPELVKIVNNAGLLKGNNIYQALSQRENVSILDLGCRFQRI